MQRLDTPIRLMRRLSSPGSKHQYQVFMKNEQGLWEAISPARPNSTTAFADLGRIVNSETEKALASMGEQIPPFNHDNPKDKRIKTPMPL